MPRILYLIDRYYPNDDALIEEVQTKILPEMGYQTTIVARTKTEDRIARHRWNGADVILIPSKYKYLSELLYIGVLREIINSEWDIVQVRNDTVFALLCLGKKMAYQLTHLKAEEFLSARRIHPLSVLKGCVDLALRPLIMRKATFVISMSKSMTRYLNDRYGVRNVSDLPMGVPETEPSKNRVKQIRKFYSLSGKVVFIYVGTMIRIRRLDLILRSYRKIESDKTALIMLGDAPNPDDVLWLKRTAEQLQLRSVTFIDRVPRSEVPNYIAAADVGLSLTPITVVNECMSPTKALEYLNCETPVLATDITDQANIIHLSESGILCRFDVNDIADKMKACVEMRHELKAMGQSGKKYVRQHRTYGAIAARLASYYDQMIGATHHTV